MARFALSRRTFITGLMTGGACAVVSRATTAASADPDCARRFAGRTIRWIVPNSPGGGYDIYSRLIAPHYESELGAEIFVDNVLGAGGIVGANAIRDSDPDGLTIGIVNAPGLLVAAMSGESPAPDPSKDFTVLGRVARSRHVMATGRNSPLRSIDDALREAEKRPIVFATREVGALSFVDIAVTSHLLGIEAAFVPGYRGGSRASVLAAARGEVDLIALTFESIRSDIETGDLRPLLQIADEPISPHPSLEGVPLFGGAEGLAVRHAGRLGRDTGEAQADARALINLIGAGRLIVAPPDLDDAVFRCMEPSLYEALTLPAFVAAAAAAQRTLDVARSDAALADVAAASARVQRFLPIFQAAITKVRQ